MNSHVIFIPFRTNHWICNHASSTIFIPIVLALQWWGAGVVFYRLLQLTRCWVKYGHQAHDIVIAWNPSPQSWRYNPSPCEPLGNGLYRIHSDPEVQILPLCQWVTHWKHDQVGSLRKLKQLCQCLCLSASHLSMPSTSRNYLPHFSKPLFVTANFSSASTVCS